jgi:hypothetical protein
MIITTKLLRGAIRDALEEAAELRKSTLSEYDVPSETTFNEIPHDRQAARAFNDPNTFPDAIVGMCDEIAKIMRLPDPSATHSLSGHAKTPDTAVAERIKAIRKLAKDLSASLEKDPIDDA